jgi:hypothetical protein
MGEDKTDIGWPADEAERRKRLQEIADGKHPGWPDEKARHATVRERFWQKVKKAGPDECWEWTSPPNERGYGCLWTKITSSFPAHKLSLILHGGTVPNGMVVDHTCRNKICVNPNHLRAVTPRINAIENNSSWAAINASKTHCRRGHPYAGDNLRMFRGKRRCRECLRLNTENYRKRKAIQSLGRKP